MANKLTTQGIADMFGAINMATDSIRLAWMDSLTMNNTFVNADTMAGTTYVEWSDGAPYVAGGQLINDQTVTEDAANGGAGFVAYGQADAVTWASTPAGGTVNTMVLLRFVTNTDASIPIAGYDTATNLPFTPNGGDVTVNSHATDGWFKITVPV